MTAALPAVDDAERETGFTPGPWRDDDEALADAAYIAAARRDPAVRKANQIALTGLGFRLWCMTREERAGVTVEEMREKVGGLLHGYVTDAEIQAVINRETNRQWVDPLGAFERLTKARTGNPA